MSVVMLVVGCGGAKRQPPDPVRPPSGLGSGTVPSAAVGFGLQCDLDRPKANPCDPFNHQINVAGDKFESCYRRANGAFKLELKSTNDPSDSVIVAIDNFTGPNTYNLDSDGRFITVGGNQPVLQCVGGGSATTTVETGITARSPGRDNSCDSRGCTVQITVPDPAQPDRHTLQVDCPELCEDNSYFVCKAAGGGNIRFSFTGDCPVI